jgi:hypothetical protein
MFVAPFTESFELDRVWSAPQIFFLVPIFALHAGQAAHEWLGLRKSVPLRLAVCVIFLILLVLVRRADPSPFLYFQF